MERLRSVVAAYNASVEGVQIRTDRMKSLRAMVRTRVGFWTQ